MSTTACAQPGCTGAIVDGYCDVCGAPAPSADASGAASQYNAGTAPGQWRPHPNPTPPNPPITDPALALGNLPAMLPQWVS